MTCNLHVSIGKRFCKNRHSENIIFDGMLWKTSENVSIRTRTEVQFVENRDDFSYRTTSSMAENNHNNQVDVYEPTSFRCYFVIAV